MPKLCSALALVVAFSSAAVMAQNGAKSAPANAGTVIAVVDINFILTKHEKHVALKDSIQKKDREAVAALQARKKNLDKEQEKLRDHKIGTPEHRSIQEKIIQQGVELEADAKVGGSQIQEDYAKGRLEILLEVQAAIKQFATRNGIDLVMNFDSEKPNIENPQMVNRYSGNLIQFQNKLDITFDILEIVSPNYAVVTPASTKAPVKTANSGGASGASTTKPRTK